jgi:hypothetical protein
MDVDQFRASVRARNAADFQRHLEVAGRVERIVIRERALSSCARIAVDMLLNQAFKAHYSVALLLEHAHTEDAATIVRRLLEIAVQAIWIGAESDADEQETKAGTYLASLWEEAPEELKAIVRKSSRQDWEVIHAKYRRKIDRSGLRWGPSFKKMFSDAGLSRTYEEDYAFLSKLSHGSVTMSLVFYSRREIPLRSDTHAPVLLDYANRYLAGIVEVWNRVFKIVPDQEWRELLATVRRGRDHPA